MPITILPPLQAAAFRPFLSATAAAQGGDDADDFDDGSSSSGSEDGGPAAAAAAAADSHRTKRRRGGEQRHEIVTPGEVITDDPQWMRGHGTYMDASSGDGTILSSLAGTVLRTNRLLSVRPLRARYSPEVGDLVVGRIVEVQARRWRVDVGAPQLASLPLSAINLPGGVLRRRTETDELQIRTFFQEGDLLVAEVQQLFASDGAAVLHTRSLRYGKLRNGVFFAVSGGGGSGTVVRARRQVWTVSGDDEDAEEVGGDEDEARHAASYGTGAGKIDVILGVNGYVFIGAHVDPETTAAAAATVAEPGPGAPGTPTAPAVGISNMEEAVSAAIYSSQNDPVGRATLREIARLRSVVGLLVEHRLPVDEAGVMRGYRAALDLARSSQGAAEGGGGGVGGGEEDVYLGGERGDKVAAVITAR